MSSRRGFILGRKLLLSEKEEIRQGRSAEEKIQADTVPDLNSLNIPMYIELMVVQEAMGRINRKSLFLLL